MRFSTFTKTLVLACVFFSFFGLNACKIDEEIGKPTFSPDFIFPTAYGKLGLKDLLTDTSFIKTDPTGYLKIFYLDTVPVVTQADLATLLEIVQNNVDVPQPLGFSSAGANDVLRSEFSYSGLAQFGLSNLTTLGIDAISFRIIINNQKNYNFNNIEIKIPGLKQGTIPFTTGVIPTIAAGTTFDQTFTVTNAIWDLTGKPGVNDTSSIIFFEFASGSPITGPSGGAATISVVFQSNDLDYWRGGSPLLPQILNGIAPIESSGQLVPASTYKNIKGGSLKINDAKIRTLFQTRLGLPMGMNMQFSTVNGVTGQSKSLDDTFKVVIDSSSLVNGIPTKKNNIYELGDTLGLVDVFSNFPTSFAVSVALKNFIDPNSTDYFVHDSSDINLLVNAEVPFAITFDSLRLQDTVKFEALSGLDFDTTNVTIDTGGFQFRLSNGFPYSVIVEIVSLDGQADSLIKLATISIPGAATQIVNGEERVVTPTVSTSILGVTQEIFNKIKEGKFLRIKATLDTPFGVDSPKIYTDYTIGFDVKVRMKVNVDTAGN